MQEKTFLFFVSKLLSQPMFFLKSHAQTWVQYFSWSLYGAE